MPESYSPRAHSEMDHIQNNRPTDMCRMEMRLAILRWDGCFVEYPWYCVLFYSAANATTAAASSVDNHNFFVVVTKTKMKDAIGGGWWCDSHSRY
eukprot:scaffold904_cov81-Skeletonema_dohrnii-CCMP3373.AAC.4